MDEAAALWKEYADACVEHDLPHAQHVLELLIPAQVRHSVDAATVVVPPCGGRSLPRNETRGART